MKKALITGVTGQDGSYLAELLLDKGYEVHGLVRRSSTFNRGRIEPLRNHSKATEYFRLHYGNMTDFPSLNKLIAQIQPDEVYNLAAKAMSASVLIFRITQHRWTRWVHSGFWRRLKTSIQKIKPAFTRLLPVNCTVRRWNPRKMKQHHFIHGVPTEWPSSTPTGLPSIIERARIYLTPAVLCSTMNLRYVD